MENNLSEKEKEVLAMLLKPFLTFIEAQSGYIELASGDFSKSDLYSLAEKFGIELEL